MNEDTISRLATRLSSAYGKHEFSEYSDDYISGVVPVTRDLADVFAIEAMARQIDEEISLTGHDELAKRFDAREILNSDDAFDISQTLREVFLND